MPCTVYILVVVAMVRGSTRGEGFVKQPGDDDLTTFVGQPLVVPCVFDGDYDVKEWRTNEESSKLITDSNGGVSQIREEFRHRYELLDDGRDFSLVIKSPVISETQLYCSAGAVFSYKLRYIVGFWLVEMAISTNQKPTIYRNLYENTGPASLNSITSSSSQIQVQGIYHIFYHTFISICHTS